MLGKSAYKTWDDLPYPFNKALSFDFKTTSHLSDHKYLEQLGYKVKMAADCSCYCGLSGLSCSSYGDWGTMYKCFCDDDYVMNIVLDMLNNNIIELFRCEYRGIYYYHKKGGRLF